MDFQDSSATPTLHHHHHHHHQLPFPSHHSIIMGQHNPIQHPSNNSYPLPNNNSPVSPTTAAASNSAMMMHHQNTCFPFNSAAALAPVPAQKPLDHHYPDGSPPGSGAWLNIEPTRKKRGRPRKYSPDNSIGLGLSPAPVTQIPSDGAHVSSSGGGGGGKPSSGTPTKRHRGRPPGSVKRQLDALGVPGVGFTPHVIKVDSGEDVASKIMAFSLQGPRTVCILSANGAICNVALRQPATSGGTVTYEGRFEIISLSGAFLPSESNSQTGALSVSLAGSDGRVLGGGVAGTLKAASPVQVVVGSFIAEGKKPKGSSDMLNFGAPVSKAGPPAGASSNSDEENDDSPIAPGSGPYGSAGRPVQNVPIYSSMGWPNSIKIIPN